MDQNGVALYLGADVPHLGQLLTPPHSLGALVWLLMLVVLLLELLHNICHDVVCTYVIRFLFWNVEWNWLLSNIKDEVNP